MSPWAAHAHGEAFVHCEEALFALKFALGLRVRDWTRHQVSHRRLAGRRWQVLLGRRGRSRPPGPSGLSRLLRQRLRANVQHELPAVMTSWRSVSLRCRTLQVAAQPVLSELRACGVELWMCNGDHPATAAAVAAAEQVARNSASGWHLSCARSVSYRVVVVAHMVASLECRSRHAACSRNSSQFWMCSSLVMCPQYVVFVFSVESSVFRESKQSGEKQKW